MHPWPLAVTLGALLLCAWPPAAALPDITTVDDGDIVMVVEDGHDVRIRHESDASGVSLFDLTGLKDVADNAERSANNYTDEQLKITHEKMQSTLSELNSTLLDAIDNSEDIWQQRIIALNSSLHQRIHSLESALDERDEQIANLYTLLRNLNSTVSGLKNFVTYGQSASDPGTSCKDILDRYHKLGESVVPSQNYWIKNPSTSPAFQVFCDMETDGGGWTLFTSIETVMGASDWSSYMDTKNGLPMGSNGRFGTAFARKPADALERIRVEGDDWHVDFRTSVTTDVWYINPCVEESTLADVLLSSNNVSPDPLNIRVHNNKGSGCSGIGHVYLSPKSGEKTTIKGVTPVSDGAFYYLLTWGEFGGWTRAPASSLGGYQTQCPTGANDVHYRCSGFIDDPNWTGVYMYWR